MLFLLWLWVPNDFYTFNFTFFHWGRALIEKIYKFFIFFFTNWNYSEKLYLTFYIVILPSTYTT